MATGASRNVDITPLGLAAVETVLWQMQGRLHVTVVVKASFAFTLDAAMTRIDPEEILRAEVHHNKNPMRSVRATGDLAPFQPRADVVLTGHACAPVGTTVEALSVRLVVFRERALIDKTIHVRGDAQGADTVPFDRVPLMYERAFGGIGWEENPLGVGAGAATSAKSPNLIDPAEPKRVAGFGPISRGWPLRKRLLGAADRKALDRPIAEIPAGFDWAYYQSAPPDQRCEFLNGSEWIVLDGMNADFAHLQSYLPSARGMARVHGVADGGAGHLLTLSADTLRIDADALVCSVTWRGSFPVPGEDALAGMRIVAGVESAGHPLEWPAPIAPASPSPSPIASIDRPTSVLATGQLVPYGASTMMLDDEPPGGPAAVRDRPVAPVEIVEVFEDVTDLASSYHTEESIDEPRVPAKWEGTLAIEPEAERAATQAPAVPFRKGPSMSPPPQTQRIPSPLEAVEGALNHGATLFIEDDAGSAAPRSLPFLKPLSPPAPARPAPLPPPAWEDPAPEPTLEIAPVRAARKRPTSGTIELVNDTALALAAVPWGLTPSRDCFTVIAKATCDLVPGGAAVVRPAADPPEGERFEDLGDARGQASASCVYPTDFALYKVRADVVLTGHACASRGVATTMEARFAFGAEGNAFDRVIVVFGDRRWEPGPSKPRPSAPEPFVRMPLVHARAFGGPKYDENPVGAGFPDRMRRGPALLPNLEDPTNRLRTPNQIARPACFAPIPRSWKDLQASRGSRRAVWPCFPEELDWTLFQAAPPAQQLGFLRGDEPFEIAGLRRDHPILAGSLPGLRARALVVRRGHPEEIAMRLDTVVFDLDAMKLHLVWRGTATVADERAPDLDAIHLFTESASAEPAAIDLLRDKALRR